MANSINWGEVYKTSWWGDEEYNQHSILNGSEPEGLGFTGFLDEHAGAVVAYSTNRLSSLYSSTLFRTRRSSDDTEDDIGFGDDNLLNTTALDDFVNADVTDDINTTTDSNADGLADGLTSTGSATTSIVTGNGHIGSAQRADYNTSGSSLQTFQITTLPPIIGQEITISFMYRSNFTLEGIGNAYSHGGNAFKDIPANTGDAIRFEAKAVWSPNGGVDGRIQPMWLRNSGEFIEISDWSVTYHTADGAVSIYEDQVDSTYNKETSDFSVGTDSYSSVNANDSLTRLDDFEGVDNVLKLEATTGVTSVHQMRKNIGQGDHFRYLVSCKIYIPTSNTGLTKVALYNGSDLHRVIDKATEGDQWVTLENEEYFGSANSRFFVAGLNDAEDLSFASTTGDKFYLADVVIDGNYDLSNGTSDEQPLIVDGGTTETDNFFDFDGSNDRLVTKAIDAFQGDFTIDLEVEIPSDTSTRQAIFTNSTSSSDRFGFTLENSRLFFEYYDGSTYTGGRVSSMTTGTYRITLTRASGVFTIYMNGTSQTIGPLVGWLGSVGNDQMVLGDYRNVTNATSPFLGRVRTCIVYDSALDQAHATAFNSLFS